MMTLRKTLLLQAWLLGVGLVWLCAMASAQPQVPPAYKLAPGDILEVLVLGEPELSILQPRGLEVAPDGTITYPHTGTVRVAGMTVNEVRDTITKALADGVLVNPQVTVQPIHCAGQKVTVVGAVRTPGVYPYSDHMTVRQALGQAGGLALPTRESTALTEARIVSADGTARAVDLDRAMRGESTQEEIALAPGDTLFVELTMNIYVLGYVNVPGVYLSSKDMRLTTALALAGGAKEPEGDLSGIKITHSKGEMVTADLTRVIAGDSTQDLVIGPGDVVYVPRLVREATILGYVMIPGKHVLDTGDRVTDLLAHAQGVSTGDQQADLTRVLLSRPGEKTRTLNLEQAITNGATDQNPLLQPGDQVFVPEADNRVVVVGYVNKPGVYNFRPGETVQVALALASGMVQGTGTASQIRIKHVGGEETAVGAKEDPVLKPGDQINVSLTHKRVTVVGYVQKPGLFEYEDGNTVVDMIAAAEGSILTRVGDRLHVEKGSSQIFLYRLKDGKYVTQRLDLAKFYSKGDIASNPQVEAGDIIYVPGTRKLDLGEVLRSVLVFPSAFSN